MSDQFTPERWRAHDDRDDYHALIRAGLTTELKPDECEPEPGR